MIRRYGLWIAIIALAAGLSGCKSAPSPQVVALELENRIDGAEFEKEFAFSLGRVSMGLAKGIANLGLHDDDPEAIALKAVNKMALAIYRVVEMPGLDGLQGISELDDALGGSGWYRVLYTREDEAGTWVYGRGDKAGGLSNIFIVALDSEELVVISLQGKLDEMLAAVLADEPSLLVGMAG